MLWEKSGILGKILVSLVGIGNGLRSGPVGAALLSYSRRHIVDFFAKESQFVFAVGNKGLPVVADVTFPLWKQNWR